MSNLLWKYYHNEDVERFRHLLANGSIHQQNTQKVLGGGTGNAHLLGSSGGSPAGFGMSPKTGKTRNASRQTGNFSGSKGQTNPVLGKAEVNSRDYAGLTLLHRAVSSISGKSTSFAMALLEHPAIDLYAQDLENGWTALHRALYFGNITLARAIVEKDNQDPSSQAGSSAQRATSSVIKVKDHEGNSPFDVYNATIARRSLLRSDAMSNSEDDSSDDEAMVEESDSDTSMFQINVDGEEVWSWGSNRNYGLGFKDEDDRQHPEKITLKRPDHLLFRFYREHLEQYKPGFSFADPSIPIPRSVEELPTLITNRPIVIRDVALSKLHSAVLTNDPESNLFICGFGPGGRLGTGDETTRFAYTCIDEGSLAGKKVTSVALGQNHTLVLTSDGEVSAFGTNTYGQLGYSLPKPALQDEEPICATPRQIFGPLKRERVVGVAASAIHSVAHTSTSLFTWGKNEGQLGLMDSDSRSLEVQTAPRRVAASLFKSHISMVSAINGATIVLLANHTVCVFTNYGYNIVKFPLHESFTNYHLKSNALTTRYDSMSNHISHVTAGGDTIAAISTRGDLFTLNLKKVDVLSNASTTNPSKIKDSLSVPERVWSLRKGNWDGIKSAAVAENGSVIVCTHAGAVWRRIKRPKSKDAFVGTGYNRKDYKFQRVPGLTNVAAVRSTPFGVYVAIRKDCDVTRTQITVDEQSLWQDVAPLLCVSNLEASQEEDTHTLRFWKASLPKESLEPSKKAILSSSDIEADITNHLIGMNMDGYDYQIVNTSSSVSIPVHGFILARSPVLRAAMEEYRQKGSASISGFLTIKPSTPKVTSGGGHTSLFGGPQNGAPNFSESALKVVVEFQSLDFLTTLNLIIYLYTDAIVDVWHFTRQYPSLAFRYRQVRVELMKTAGYLKIPTLESAVRLMTEPEPQLNFDLGLAFQDFSYFDDGDTIIELDDDDKAMVHSVLLCQRCPFFDGMFNGRAGGKWLDQRRESDSELVRIDMKHISLKTFKLVLRYIYTDAGNELFDEVVSADIDEFSELVMDVMSVANELMLDRLSQICQGVIGRFVTTRNVCQLLNAIAPCSVKEFKDSALEYTCLQLESMLENNLLSDLDDDLLLELDAVVRANQLNCLPYAKSGRAELLLHEDNPELAEDVLEERQRRVRDMVYRVNMQNEESRLSSSYKVRMGSIDDNMSTSPSQEKVQRKSKVSSNVPFSPKLRAKDSVADLMFNMDEDAPLRSGSIPRPNLPLPVRNSRQVSWDVSEAKPKSNDESSSYLMNSPETGPNKFPEPSSATVKTWSSSTLQSKKLGLQEIMSQASSGRTSELSMSLSAQRVKDQEKVRQESSLKASLPKLSQKERKKQQQQMAKESVPPPTISMDNTENKSSSPWQVAAKGAKTSLKDILGDSSSNLSPVPQRKVDSPLQSISSTPRRTASPDTRFPGQRRTVSGNIPKQSPATDPSRSSPIVPQSKSYTAPASKAEPSLQLSMSDIIFQQRREQEVIKEAVAKRSLQEIQEEQAFQEWWDVESRRAQEEEAARANVPARGGKSGAGSTRGKSGRGRGGRGRGESRGRGRGGSEQEKVADK